jgi:outer membrane immunogenic protein
MRHVSIAVIAAATIIALTQVATAADIARPVYKAPPPAPPPQDWSGIYVGLEGGYGWGKETSNLTLPGGCFGEGCFVLITAPTLLLLDNNFVGPEFFPNVAVPSVNTNGWLFGGFAGAQKQWGSWVLGIEGDFDGADIKGSATSSAVSKFHLCNSPCLDLSLTHSVSIQTKIDELASLRGKIGWALAPNWLIYGTGGAAWAHATYNITDTQTFVETFIVDPPPDTGTSSNSGSAGASLFGWAAGAGVDWKWPIDPGSAVVLGVEYLHYDFPENTVVLADNFGFGPGFTSKQQIDTVKGRISYLFSIH